LTGEADPAAVSALDLHLRDGSLGRIRRIEGLDRLVNLRQLNLSYNAITKIENLSCLSRSLVELNLAENDISSVRSRCILIAGGMPWR
jgi:Leucine-rich repeat (LRR) protein